MTGGTRSATRLVALLGDPVAHSVSPAIHSAGFRAHSLDLAYLACGVAPAHLTAAVDGLWALGAVGANVTAPHKEAVAQLVTDRSREVEAVGAANTLVRGADGWRAENTDIEGLLAPLETSCLAGVDAVVLGAGGAARAAVYALATRTSVARITVVARRHDQAAGLVDALAPVVSGVRLDTCTPDATRAVRDARLVVNATPVGTDDPDATPWPDAGDFGPDQTVYDLVYRPAETRLLRVARAAGAETIGGLPMLLAQAAASFRLWTGRDLPLDAAREAAEQALAS